MAQGRVCSISDGPTPCGRIWTGHPLKHPNQRVADLGVGHQASGVRRQASGVNDDGDDQRAASVLPAGPGCHGFADQLLGLLDVDVFL